MWDCCMVSFAFVGPAPFCQHHSVAHEAHEACSSGFHPRRSRSPSAPLSARVSTRSSLSSSSSGSGSARRMTSSASRSESKANRGRSQEDTDGWLGPSHSYAAYHRVESAWEQRVVRVKFIDPLRKASRTTTLSLPLDAGMSLVYSHIDGWLSNVEPHVICFTLASTADDSSVAVVDRVLLPTDDIPSVKPIFCQPWVPPPALGAASVSSGVLSAVYIVVAPQCSGSAVRMAGVPVVVSSRLNRGGPAHADVVDGARRLLCNSSVEAEYLRTRPMFLCRVDAQDPLASVPAAVIPVALLPPQSSRQHRESPAPTAPPAHLLSPQSSAGGSELGWQHHSTHRDHFHVTIVYPLLAVGDVVYINTSYSRAGALHSRGVVTGVRILPLAVTYDVEDSDTGVIVHSLSCPQVIPIDAV